MKKAQVQLVSAVLIVTIALVVFSVGYRYLKPLMEKKEDTRRVDRVDEAFDQLNPSSLPSKIETISKLGGEESFSLNVDGLWTLNESQNYIQFSFLSMVTNLDEKAGWISLTTGANCSDEPPPNGIVGIDKISVVCAKAERMAGKYQITYRLWYRNLTDVVTGLLYKISLEKDPAGRLQTTSKSFVISKGDVEKIVVDDQTLIVTKVKIRLV
jgi:hypothetical protein